MSKSITIKSHDFGNITVGTCRSTGYLCSNSFQLDKDSPTPTILDLRAKALEVLEMPLMTGQTYSAMTQQQVNEYNWQPTIETFNQSAYWIWGDVRGGGVALIHYPQANKISFFVSNGYYSPTSNDNVGRFQCHYYFPMDLSTKPSDALKSVFWAYFITSPLQSNLISPYPTDTYSQYVVTFPNVDLDRTAEQNPHPIWYKQLSQEVVESGQTVWTRDFYDPPTYNNWQNRFEEDTWGHLTGAGKDTKYYLSFESAKNYCFDYCIYVQAPFWVGGYLNGNILDDDLYGFSGYNHKYGSWHGQIVPDPDEDEPNEPQGGGGRKPTTVTPIPKTDVSNWTDVTATGFVRLYKPVSGELWGLANYMFGSLTDADATHLKKLLANPLDYIISLNMVHLSPTCSEYDEDVKLGGLSIGEGLGMLKLDQQFYTYDGGSIFVERAFDNFHDYAPFTRCQIIVPYCGIHDLPVDIVMNSTLSLQYVIDFLSGAVLAQLCITKYRTLRGEADDIVDSVLYQYTGNCFTPCPLANTDYRGAVNGILGIAGSAVTSMVSGNPLPLASGVSNAVVNSKPSVTSNVSTAGNYGFLGAQEAYLILTRPVQNMASDVNGNTMTGKWLGYRSNMFRRVDAFSGVLTVKKDTFWMEETATNATKEEIDEIKQLLEGGICV